MHLVRLFSVLALMALAGLASAQVQKCTDANGKVSFLDTPCPNNSVKAQSTGISSYTSRAEAERYAQSTSNDLSADNRAFNARHAARNAQSDRNAIAQGSLANQRALIDNFNKPLAPGETRRITIKPVDAEPAPAPKSVKASKTP